MMSFNRSILVGRLAQDPEVRYTANEIPVAKFALAVERPSKNGDKEVDFINIVAWRGLAKVCGEYLKGKPIAVEGRLQVRKYEKDGEKRTFTEIIADNMQMLDTKFFKASEKGSKTESTEENAVEIEEAPKKSGK